MEAAQINTNITVLLPPGLGKAFNASFVASNDVALTKPLPQCGAL